MKRETKEAVILLIIILLYAVAILRSQELPCYVPTATGCAAKLWRPMDTLINSYPAVIERYPSTGSFVLDVCWAGMNVSSYPCSGVAPNPVTLQDWCGRLRILPVPPKYHDSDPADLYSEFVKKGVCQ